VRRTLFHESVQTFQTIGMTSARGQSAPLAFQLRLPGGKVDKLHKRYQRTQTQVDHYEQLTVVIG
jgi:hypothetical protein